MLSAGIDGKGKSFVNEEINKLREAGFDGVLGKPLSFHTLLCGAFSLGSASGLFRAKRPSPPVFL